MRSITNCVEDEVGNVYASGTISGKGCIIKFDIDGNEVRTDYYKMMNIVLNHGYTGYVGIEYEGNNHSEYDGIHLTSKLLRKIQEQNS